MINIEYLMMLINKTLEDELNFLNEQKEKLTHITSNIRFHMIISVICLHLCIRPFSDPLERLTVLLGTILLSKRIALSIFEEKMKRITEYWNKFQNVIDKVNPLFIYDEIPLGILNAIENDIENATKKTHKYGFLSGYKIDVIVHTSCLLIGLFFFINMPINYFSAGIYSLLFSYYTAKTAIEIKKVKIL